MLGKRLINSNSAAAGGSCTTDTLNILGDSPNSCIAYYKMSDATDESGSYDGTPTDVNFNVAGKFGNAGSFNGSSSKIEVQGITGMGANDFTYSCWFNTNSTAVSNFNILTPYTADHFFYGIQIYSTTIGAYSLNASAGGEYIISNSGTITTGTWYHVAYVKSSTAGHILYLNGSVVASDSNFTGNMYNPAGYNSLWIGNAQNIQYFNGKIDQVRTFNKALSSTEVTTLYNEVYCVPTIVPTDYFEPVIYTGNGGTKSITSLNFEPDFTWIKIRTLGYNHYLIDSVRGATEILQSNLTDAESTQSTSLTSFDTNGFTVGSKLNVNANTEDFVSWNWKAGGAAVSNTDGTITSQVSANTDSGFSVVKYTGNGNTSQQSYGHGLSSAPELVFNKGIDTLTLGTNFWVVGGTILGNGGYMFLNVTNGKNTASSYNGNQVPDSNVVYISGTSDLISNENNKNFISYCFHSVDGYSKIGSYVGTGATGNSIVTGFRPAFVMTKTTNTNSSWFFVDNKRNVDNPRNSYLMPDNSSATVNAGSGINFLSNGFEFTGVAFNDSGNSWIFMAIAEEVFNPNGVTRNATNPFGDASELALYKFEDNANDAEGSYNGTASNVTYATGYIDKAAVFNGSSSYISTGINFSTLPNTKSISMWIKSTGSSSIGLGGMDGSYGNNGLFSFDESAGDLSYIPKFGGYHNGDASTVVTNAWNHFVVTDTNVDGNVKMYINGSEVTVTKINSTVYTNNTNMQIGRQMRNNGTAFWQTGSIDQVRVFNRALDSGEVTQLYNE